MAVVRNIKNVAVDKRVGKKMFEKAAKERDIESLNQRIELLGGLL